MGWARIQIAVDAVEMFQCPLSSVPPGNLTWIAFFLVFGCLLAGAFRLHQWMLTGMPCLRLLRRKVTAWFLRGLPVSSVGESSGDDNNRNIDLVSPVKFQAAGIREG